MRDSEIEQFVLNEIRLKMNGRLKELSVLSMNGVVSLKGTVLSRSDKAAAKAAAEAVKGVVGIVNQLNLRPRSLTGRRASMKKQAGPAAARSFPIPTRNRPTLHG
jgi:hypothetical protein